MQIMTEGYPVFVQKAEFREKLRVLGLSQKRFAQKIGVSHSTVLHWSTVPEYAEQYVELLISAKEFIR